MKFKYLKAIAMCVFLGASNSAIAGIIYDFDVSSQTISSNRDFSGYSVVFEFSNDTDFNNVQIENIERFGFSYENVEYSGSTFEHYSNVKNLFSTDTNGDVILTLGGSYNPADIRWSDGDNSVLVSQTRIDKGGYFNLSISVNGYHNYVSTTLDFTNDFIGVARTAGVPAIPEPSTLAIFTIGMLGLVSRRYKNKP